MSSLAGSRATVLTANERVGVAVVGAGHWGPNLIRAFSNSQSARLVTVVDTDRNRLRQVADRYPGVGVTTEIADILADDTVRAVVVATPTSTHAPLANAVLEAGKHVFVEKPLAGSSLEGGLLCRLAVDRSLVLMVGHIFIYNAAVRHVRRLIADGELGRLYYLSMIRTNLGPIRVDVDAAWDLAAHDVSIANHWLDAEPMAVSAVGGSWINSGLNDAVFATLRYPAGVLVNLHVSWLNPRKAREITVVGDRRMLTLDDMSLSEPIRIFDKQVEEDRVHFEFTDTFASFRASVRDGDIVIPKVPSAEPLSAECEHFLECIRLGKQALTDGPAGVAVVRALEAIRRSAEAGGREEPVK